MADLKLRRSCVKYGNIMTDSWRVRTFCFDMEEKKYRYFQKKEDVIDKVKKRMDLGKCEYEITSKFDQGITKWEDYSNKGSQYRLGMKFEQRNRRPIYVYSNDLDELHNLKNFGLYCKKEEQNINKLELLLSSVSYGNGRSLLNLIISLFQNTIYRSKIMLKLINNICGGKELMRRDKIYLLDIWGRMTVDKYKRYRTLATIRLSHFLRSLAHIRNINEEQIIKAAQEILKAYKLHRSSGKGVFDEEIVEKASRGTRGVIAAAEFNISEQIIPIASGKQAVPREHMGFVKFEFPQRPFKESKCQLVIDNEEYRIYVSSSKDKKTYGELLVGDISSMILNDGPDKGKAWLRINGRKIKNAEEFSNFYM